SAHLAAHQRRHLPGREEVGAVGDQRGVLADDPVLRDPDGEAVRGAAAQGAPGRLRRRAYPDPLRGRRRSRRRHLRSERRHLGHDPPLPSGPRHLHHSRRAVLRARSAPGPLGPPGHRRDQAPSVAGRVRAEEGARRRPDPIRGLSMITRLLMLAFVVVLALTGVSPALGADEVTLALDWIVNGTHAGYYV